jgi:translation initiation factor IF-2
MAGLLEPIYQENFIGRVEVKEIFRVPKVGTVAGCYVTEGHIERNANIRLLRDEVVVYNGKLSSLRRFKDDVKEVQSGYECGIGLENYQDIKPGDVFEVYEVEEIAAEL